MDKKTFYVTTPIYYPSDKLHIGHTYSTVAADTIARYKREKGYDVMFLTGTDEHGQKIERKAKESGQTPKEYVDRVVAGILDLWKLMNISNDRFIRTTDKQHEVCVQKIFKKLYDQGDIYKSQYEGLYCTPCEAFWTKTQVTDGKCPDCGRPVEVMREESYFLKLSKYADKLISYMKENNDFIKPESRMNEMLNNFLLPGLEDLCVSRTSFKWGIPVDFDPGHVVYVWIDALSNYITALGYLSEDDSDFKKYWPADVHFVGKEIIRFHTIIWPIMLMALDLPLPKQIFGHGWLLLEGKKMSKSSGNVVDPVILAKKYGVDALRYFLLREFAFGVDGVFTNEALITRINADLANDLGNLVSRTITMTDKYFKGTLPSDKNHEPVDDEIINMANGLATKVDVLFDNLQFNQVLIEIWKLTGRCNKYIDETMPWVLAKDEKNFPRLTSVLYNLSEALRIVSILIRPFMPDTSAIILERLGLSGQKSVTVWESAYSFGQYPENIKIKTGDIIFPRIDMEKDLMEFAKLSGANENEEETKKFDPIKPEVTIDDFAKMDFRVGKILEAEKVEGSDKLIKMKIDIGIEIRQVVSGIAKYYQPSDMVGKQVVLVANLKPARIRGVDSQGMILCAGGDDAELFVVSPEKPISEGLKVT